jgi:hypothetical protein
MTALWITESDHHNINSAMILKEMLSFSTENLLRIGYF